MNCSQPLSTGNDSVVDTMSIIFTLNDFVYLNGRLFIKDSPENEEEENSNITEEGSKSFISREEQRKHQTIDVLRVLRLFCLNIGCWHVIFERECGNPYYHYQHNMYNNINEEIQECGPMCPNCDGTKECMF